MSQSQSVNRSQGIGPIFARYGIVLSFALLVVVLAIASPNFLSPNNLFNVLRQVSINGVLAIGMTFVILTAGIDLSVGSILALAGAVTASLVTGDAPFHPLIAVAAGIGTGLVCGGVNGILIARFNMPAFVVTLGMLSVARGATLLYSGGRPIPNLSSEFRWLGQGTILGVPVPVIIFAVVFAIAAFVLRYTIYGRRVYAVGGNPKSARTSGINPQHIIFSVYAIMGAMAGLAGVMLTARTTSALPQAGIGYELDAIAAVVIGGTSLTGGLGRISYTLIGVLLIGVISNGLDLLGVSSYYQQIIKGSIIVFAVMVDRSRAKSD